MINICKSQNLNLGGAASGNCASGFGVCCLFTGTCGGTSSFNNTYFKVIFIGPIYCQEIMSQIFFRALVLIPPPAPSKFVKPVLTFVNSDLTLILLLHHNPPLFRNDWLSWSLYWLKLIITFMITLKETMQFIDQKKCSLLHQKNSKFTIWIKCFCGNKAWYQGNQSLNLAWRHLIQWQNTVFEVQL